VGYPAWLSSWTRYGFLGVELFFFISGMVIFNSVGSGSARRFAESRFIRLFPAYWAAVVFTWLVIRLWAGGIAHLSATPGMLVANLTMLQSFLGVDLLDGVYWTLAAELVFYVIVGVTLALGQQRHLFKVLVGWLGAMILFMAAKRTGVLPDRLAEENRIYLMLEWAPYFVAGACCALIGRGRRDLRVWGVLAVAAVASLGEAGRHTHAIASTFPPGSYRQGVSAAIVAAFLLVVLATATGRLRRIGRPWMVAAGALTYPLYLIHQNVGYVLFLKLDDLNRWVLLVAITGLMLGGAWVINRAVERPSARFLKRALR
jgi:peptidoglycan/LPS O-acetylase OafA/YrhL